jgi:hypothetical protein
LRKIEHVIGSRAIATGTGTAVALAGLQAQITAQIDLLL